MNGAHVALSVTDLHRSSTWYQDLFGGQEVFRGNDGVSDVAIYAIADTILLGLRQHGSTTSTDRFSHERCGLDHFGMHVTDKSDLEKWQSKLEERGVEHSGIVESPFGHHLNFKDPDGIALELMAARPQ
ncbi:MAG: VOC family protein [Actinomycetes bacterium]